MRTKHVPGRVHAGLSTTRGSAFVVGGLSARCTTGFVRCGGTSYTCALGRGGRVAGKREGDGATPIGAWQIREIFYRVDRVARPRSRLPTRAIRRTDGWCDDIGDRNYNRGVTHPYNASAERLWRDDAVYDIVVVLGYNDRPRKRGRGSAIFMHLARPGYRPTEGCVALTERNLRQLLSRANRRSVLRVLA